MVRLQAAEDGTVGNGANFRLVRKNELFNLISGPQPEWTAVVPDGTKEPLLLKRDPKAKKWVVAGEVPAPNAGPQSFGEMTKAQETAARQAMKNKSVDQLA